VSTDRPRIVLVEDEQLTRAGARAMLEPRFEVVGEADNVTDAVAMIRELEPDLVLLDIRIREGTGIDVVKQVRRTHPGTRFVAMTVSTSRRDVTQAFNVGVAGYLTKNTIGPDLADLVDDALRGGRVISPEVAGYLLDIDESVVEDSGVARLSPEEREIVVLMARGRTYRETAAELRLAVRVLETHMRSIFEKLGVASRRELAAIAREAGVTGGET
jgi:DNA-binding NarL/FixJ family response regulator